MLCHNCHNQSSFNSHATFCTELFFYHGKFAACFGKFTPGKAESLCSIVMEPACLKHWFGEDRCREFTPDQCWANSGESAQCWEQIKFCLDSIMFLFFYMMEFYVRINGHRVRARTSLSTQYKRINDGIRAIHQGSVVCCVVCVVCGGE